MEPFQSFCTLIPTITGIGQRCAGGDRGRDRADMNGFPTAAHLASWAGTCPGGNESAGRVKSTATRPGNAYLKAALGRAVDHQHSGQLSVGEVQADRRPARTQEGPGRGRARTPS